MSSFFRRFLLKTTAFSFTALFWTGCGRRGPASFHPRPLLLPGGEGSVFALAVSPSGDYIVAADPLRPLELRSRQSGNPLRTLGSVGYNNFIWRIAFSPDSRTLAAAQSNGEIILWNTQTGTLRRTLTGHKKDVRAVAFSPDGRSVASGADDRTVRLTDGQTGTTERVFGPLTYGVYTVAFSPDGKRLLAADRQGNVRIWDTQSGKRLLALAAPPVNDVSAQGMFYPVAFSPDGLHIARADYDNKIRLFEANTGKPAQILPGHEEPAFVLVFSPDSRTLVSVGQSGKSEVWTNDPLHDVRVWDVRAGTPIAQSTSARYPCAAFDPGGQTFLTGDEGESLLIWSLPPHP